MSINLFDVVFVIVIVAFTSLSLLRGALTELLTLLGLGGGLLLGRHYAVPLARQLEPLLPDTNAAELLAFLLLVLLGYFAGVFVAGFSDMFRRSPSGGISQALGGVVGFGKGVVVSLAMFWVVQSYVPAFQDEMADSRIGALLGSLLTYLEQWNLI